MTNINSFLEAAESFYKELNNFASKGVLPLIDIAFPNHDGNADEETMANLMALRDRLNAIKNGCDVTLQHISDVIDNED